MRCASPAGASLAMLTGLENKILGIWFPSLTYTNEEATLIRKRRAGFKPESTDPRLRSLSRAAEFFSSRLVTA